MPFLFQSVPDLAFQSPAAQELFALSALNAQLAYLKASSPFYRELFEKNGLDSNIQSIADLRTFPFTTKEDIQVRNQSFLCVPKTEVREYNATSGTMGKPVSIALTENDLLRLAYNEAQSFRTAGIKSGELVQLALTLDRQFMAGMAYYSGLRALGAASVRTGPGLPTLQWETAQRLKTDAIIAVPSSLLAMAEWTSEQGMRVGECSIQKAICIGEPLRNADFSLNALGEKLQATWPLRLYSTYAATELQTAFTECEAACGGHQQPDLIIVEIVDDRGNVLADGETGEVVVTTLGVEGMPLLRYKTGDIAALHAEPCSCGRFSKRLGPVVGRKGQALKYRGTTLYPPAILDVLAILPFVKGSLVEVYTGDVGTDELRLHIHSSVPDADCEAALRPLLQARLRVIPSFQFHTVESLQALQMAGAARKAIRFLDNRKR